jgi:hypothetical protein
LITTTEEGKGLEGTQVLYGIDEIIKFILPRFAALRKKLDVCLDYTGPCV